MTRLILAVLAIAVFTQLETFTSNCSAQAGCKPCYRPDPDPNKKVENKAPDVIDVALDRTQLKRPFNPSPSNASEMRVNVVTTAVDPEGDVLMYNYTISGGRIVGAGAKVTWDLNGVMAGTYTITAGVDDGCGICGKRETQTVTIDQD